MIIEKSLLGNYMMNTIYVVILKYTVQFEKLLKLIPEHRLFLQPYYDDETILFSGPLVNKTGGIIVLRASHQEWVENLFLNDPFAINHVANYKILELEVKGYQKFLDHWFIHSL